MNRNDRCFAMQEHSLQHFYINVKHPSWYADTKVYFGSLPERHGASSGCGCRNGLQLWRVAANTLNKQSRTANKGWSSSLGLGEVLTTHLKKLLCYELDKEASDLDRFFGTAPATEKGHEFRNMECEEHV
jgi:hypothetical protein